MVSEDDYSAFGAVWAILAVTFHDETAHCRYCLWSTVAAKAEICVLGDYLVDPVVEKALFFFFVAVHPDVSVRI